jgi:hypothetical protein
MLHVLVQLVERPQVLGLRLRGVGVRVSGGVEA